MVASDVEKMRLNATLPAAGLKNGGLEIVPEQDARSRTERVERQDVTADGAVEARTAVELPPRSAHDLLTCRRGRGSHRPLSAQSRLAFFRVAR